MQLWASWETGWRHQCSCCICSRCWASLLSAHILSCDRHASQLPIALHSCACVHADVCARMEPNSVQRALRGHYICVSTGAGSAGA